MKKGERHRPQLDGIRAVAVLLVVGYHLGFAMVPGGFTGVDVFFVLSGYLISGLLLAEAAVSDRIRVGRFYASRAPHPPGTTDCDFPLGVLLRQVGLGVIGAT